MYNLFCVQKLANVPSEAFPEDCLPAEQDRIVCQPRSKGDCEHPTLLLHIVNEVVKILIR